MEGPTITLQEAISVIDSGEIFSVSFVKCDRKRRTGGERREVRSAVKYRNPHNENSHPGQAVAGVPATGTGGSHHSNKRLIYELSTRKKVSVFLRLITHLNGARVL